MKEKKSFCALTIMVFGLFFWQRIFFSTDDVTRKKPNLIYEKPEYNSLQMICGGLVDLLALYEAGAEASAEVWERCALLSEALNRIAWKEEDTADSSASEVEVEAKLLKNDLRKMELAGHLQELQVFVLTRMQPQQQEQQNEQVPHEGLPAYQKYVAIMGESALRGLRNLTAQLEQSADGSRVQKRRHEMAKLMGEQLFSHMEKLQKEKLPGKDKTLICSGEMNSGGGFTFMVNLVSWCLAAAVSSNRTMIYQRQDRFLFKDDHLLPMSNVTENGDYKVLRKTVPAWPNTDPKNILELMDINLMYYPKAMSRVIASPFKMPPHIPPHVDPQDQLALITTVPLAWYIGHLANYIIRPRPDIRAAHKSRADYYDIALDSQHGPLQKGKKITAGIHVRRGNKVSERESPAQPLWKYMVLVEEIYRKYELRLGEPLERRVFIFAEDITVLEEAYRDYPHYTILSNTTIVANAQGNQSHCYNYEKGGVDSVKAIFLDVLLMVEMDFFVCTLSSNVARLVYALKTAKYPGAPNTIYSLDFDWYFEKMLHSFRYRAISSHNPPLPPARPDADQSFPPAPELTFARGDTLHSSHRFRIMKEPWAWSYFEGKFPDGVTVGFNMTRTTAANRSLAQRHSVGIMPKVKLELMQEELRD